MTLKRSQMFIVIATAWLLLCVVSTVSSTQTAGGVINMVAAGASFPERFYDALAFAFASELPEYSLSYVSMGSSRGKCRILDYATNCNQTTDATGPFQLDWAGTDSIHRASDYLSYPDLQMYPAVAGAVVAIYNLPPAVTDLVLPLDVLADIFRKCDPDSTCSPGWISYWNDSRIVAANPLVPVQTLTDVGEIKVVVRADGSGTTEIFKQALASASADFGTQIGLSNLNDSNKWRNCSVIRGHTNRGVAAKVLNTPGAIGYVSLDEATSSGLRFAGIGRSVLSDDGILRATEQSIENALLERGFSFGNNGDVKEHLTASVMGAKGSEAWPIVGYTYFSVRLNASDCFQRKAVLHWFEWFYRSDTVVDIAKNQGFAVLPLEGRLFILRQIRLGFRCQDDVLGMRLVSTTGEAFPVRDSSQERTVQVTIRVPVEIGDVVSLYSDAYRKGDSGFAKIQTIETSDHARRLLSAGDHVDVISTTTILQFPPNRVDESLNSAGSNHQMSTEDPADIVSTVTVTQLPGPNRLEALNPTASTPVEILIKDTLSFLQAATTTASIINTQEMILPFAAIPWGITYNFCDVETDVQCAFAKLDLVLTPELVGDMLAGAILYWNDSRIQEVQSSAEQSAMLPFLPVFLVEYQETARERFVFSSLLQLRGLNLASTYSNNTAKNYEEAARRVATIPGSFTYGPVNRQMDATLSKVARMRSTNAIESSIVTGDVDSVIACRRPLGAVIEPHLSANDAVVDSYELISDNRPFIDGCWPFLNAYFVTIPSEFTTDECLSRSAQEATLFVAFLMKGFNNTVQDPLSLVGMAKLDDPQSPVRVGELHCFGRSITMGQVDMQLIPFGLIWTSRAVAGMMILFVIALGTWIFLKRAEPVIRASSPIFMWQMCFGFILELCAVFALTVQDDDHSAVTQLELDAACMAAPWLYVVGFSLVYGSLLAKTWRIYKIFNNPAMRRIRITALYLTRLELLISIPILLVLILWTTMDPFRWVRNVATVDPTTGIPVATKGECVSNHLIRYIVPILSIFAAYILSGLILAWKNRETPTEFSEGRYVTAAIMTDTELLIIGAPILVITSSNPIAAFVVKVLFIFLSVGATIGVFFYPKFAIVNGFWLSDSTSGGANKPILAPRPLPRNSKSSKRSGGSFISRRISNHLSYREKISNPSGNNDSGTPKGSRHRGSSFVPSVNESSRVYRTGSLVENMSQAKNFFSSIGKRASDGVLLEGDEPFRTSSIGGPSDLISAFPPAAIAESSSFSYHWDLNGVIPTSSPKETTIGDDDSSKDSVVSNRKDGIPQTAAMFFGRNVISSSANDLSALKNNSNSDESFPNQTMEGDGDPSLAQRAASKFKRRW